jgi:hypothetical protein
MYYEFYVKNQMKSDARHKASVLLRLAEISGVSEEFTDFTFREEVQAASRSTAQYFNDGQVQPRPTSAHCADLNIAAQILSHFEPTLILSQLFNSFIVFSPLPPNKKKSKIAEDTAVNLLTAIGSHQLLELQATCTADLVIRGVSFCLLLPN